ncbi:FAD-binding oxidoreductase [Mycolicibacterium neworleansense]|uniref:Mitomycin radical oxidase n=1 Tax=Mycolicibacterium neworleansense TaxID=146018 RepID=A0A0H5RNH0_9MYCO|nr:FAD-binding oxidoreductase [Mycolicibacterium neworleansense]MCV7364746.1 FAD-binding oxidoreductase [Mycolicibacterium neworleansense]CRZ15538.1 mitomycin radical oxidase [Mycolicibacterium neworleansense]
MTLTDLAHEGLDDALEGLRAHVAAPVALPGEAGYERAAPWNVAATVEPAAVVLATTAYDIANTVGYAAARGYRVSVQATGHGALSVASDTILVVTSGMTNVTVDPVARTARVAAGATWQHVLDAAAPHGLAGLCGSSPSVGVVGYLTGGGIGPLVRTVGLSSDHVRSFELVTGAGELLRATPEENAELFWGLRGGKSTLGIVTTVEIDLLPIAEFYGGALYFDGADAAVVLREWARWCADLPESISTSIALQQLPPLPGVPEPLAGRFTVAVRYVAVGDFAEAERRLVPMRAVAVPVLDTVAVMPYAAIGAVHADPVDPMPIYEHHTLLRELTAETVEVLLGAAGPDSGSVQTIVEVRMLGGALAREGQHRSAFCHRDAAFAVAVIGVLAPPVADLVVPQAGALIVALSQWSSGGQIANFAPSEDAGRAVRVYDDETRHWLSALGERHDPAGVFRCGQVVRS